MPTEQDANGYTRAELRRKLRLAEPGRVDPLPGWWPCGLGLVMEDHDPGDEDRSER